MTDVYSENRPDHFPINHLIQYIASKYRISDDKEGMVQDTFVSLIESFQRQIREMGEYFVSVSAIEIEEKIAITSKLLLLCKPDKISLQLTNDGSVFYTIICGDLVIYFERYIVKKVIMDEPEEDSEECLVAVKKRGRSVIAYFGGFERAIYNLLTLPY